VSYKNLGQAGLDFLREWAAQGARVRVSTTLNPAGMNLHAWRELGIPQTFARQQLAVVEAYRAMGISPTCSCTPYLVGNVPGFGEHVAWAESSAVSFANSVLGARTNREGGHSALAAALTGRTAAYGLHLIGENPLMAAGSSIVLLIVVIALLAPWIAPYPEDSRGATHIEERFKPPSLRHLLVFSVSS